MSALFSNNKVLLKLKDFIDNTYVLSYGVKNVEGYDNMNFYINSGEANQIITFKIHPENNQLCNLIFSDNQVIWSGAPVIINIDSGYIDLTTTLSKLSPMILVEGYSMFGNKKLLRQLSEYKNVFTYFNTIKYVKNGIQISGYIKAGENSDISNFSVNHIINLYKISNKPMVGRVGDPRIGYFYHNLKLDTETKMTGNPQIIIDRMNINKAPWIYVIDTSIPQEYHQQIKSGILSWNNYFAKLNLGEPFKVICYGDTNYPKNIDVFDMNYWYVVGSTANNFNGPYSGYSMSIVDYRSGEILFGMISLNLTKIISNPTRYLVMNGNNPKDKSVFASYFEQYITWITTHEVGHQLGLRHNFMGVFTNNNVSTVMDYVDIFNDLNALRNYNPWGSIREYDILAIEYGYTILNDEQHGVKHPYLYKVLEKLETPFGTDENYNENINPLIGTTEDTNDPLIFVEKILPIYRKYRNNLLKFVKSGTITPYEYNTMFLYLYTQKYPDIAKICLKFIGGRYYDKDRTYFMPVKKDSILRAIKSLLWFLDEIEYSVDEYKYIIYDYNTVNEKQLYNRVKIDTIYSLNVRNLYHFYQNIINRVFKDLISNHRFIRLSQNQQEFYPIDLLYNFTFSYATNNGEFDINNIDGIFPEIGAFLAGDGKWQDLLLNISDLKYNQQYMWVERLIYTYQNVDSYLTKNNILAIIRKIKDVVPENIIPFINSQGKNKQRGNRDVSVRFWKNKDEKLINHWSMIYELTNTLQSIQTK